MKAKTLLNFMEGLFGKNYLRMRDQVYCNAAKMINFEKLAEYKSSLEVTVNYDSQDYLVELTWICVIEAQETFRLMNFLNHKLVNNLGFEKMLTRKRVFNPNEMIKFEAM